MIECAGCEMLLAEDEVFDWVENDAYCKECYRRHVREVSDFIEGDAEYEDEDF